MVSIEFYSIKCPIEQYNNNIRWFYGHFLECRPVNKHNLRGELNWGNNNSLYIIVLILLPII